MSSEKLDLEAIKKLQDIDEGITAAPEITTDDYAPERDNEISQLYAGVNGILSGLIKIPEGVVSLGAELSILV